MGCGFSNPENWVYWRQRAGNDIANQLYLEGDYLNALEVYKHLAELDSGPAWQLPVWYQIGLIYERLRQPDKATETFDAIVARGKILTGPTNTPRPTKTPSPTKQATRTPSPTPFDPNQGGLD